MTTEHLYWKIIVWIWLFNNQTSLNLPARVAQIEAMCGKHCHVWSHQQQQWSPVLILSQTEQWQNVFSAHHRHLQSHNKHSVLKSSKGKRKIKRHFNWFKTTVVLNQGYNQSNDRADVVINDGSASLRHQFLPNSPCSLLLWNVKPVKSRIIIITQVTISY